MADAAPGIGGDRFEDRLEMPQPAHDGFGIEEIGVMVALDFEDAVFLGGIDIQLGHRGSGRSPVGNALGKELDLEAVEVLAELAALEVEDGREDRRPRGIALQLERIDEARKEIVLVLGSSKDEFQNY